ncbi:MAG: hypothetical protein GXZ02_04865, partial [Clostridiales bacterium]|nr:hypothetical protein [Clostridiales bacterium]
MIKSHDKSKALVAKLLLYVFDVVAVNIAFVIAIILINPSNYTSIVSGIVSLISARIVRFVLVTIAYLLVFKIFGLYDNVWKYAGFYELFQCVLAAIMGGVLSVGIEKIGNFFGLRGVGNSPGSAYINSTLMIIAMIGGIRLLY